MIVAQNDLNSIWSICVHRSSSVAIFFRDSQRRSKPIKHLILPAVAILAAGCTVGPDYHTPQTPTPTAFLNPSTAPTTQTSATVSRPVDLVEWWTTFHDPVLNSLIHRAVNDNLDLQQATARLRAARGQRGVIGATQLPELDASGYYHRSGAGRGNVTTSTTPGGTTVVHNNAYRQDNYQYGFDATWELDVFGGVRRSVEAADANIVSAIEDRRDVLVSLVAEVAVDYIALRGYQYQLQIAEDNLTAERRTADLTRRKFNAGFVSRLDVANADAQVFSTEADIPTLEIQARQMMYALSTLLAHEPGALVEELSAARPIPPLPPEVPIGLPAELLRRRPDIRRAEAQLHAATAQIGVATSALYPQFTLSGSLDIQASHLRGLGNWANNLWSVGPSVTWPIFAGGRILANIDVQNAVQQQALLTYRQTVLAALQDVENALIAYSREQARRNTLVEAVSANQQALALATRLYEQGQTDFLNVLNAERSVFNSQTLLNQSNVNIATDLASLYKALGGGWAAEPVTTNQSANPSRPLALPVPP